MWLATLVIGVTLAWPPTPAGAWAPTAHLVIAEMAWQRLTPDVRATVIALLKAAPADAHLAGLMPADDRPAGVREQEFFGLASTWADIVREGAKAERQAATGERHTTRPERQAAYHRSEWHYINWFWRPGPQGPVDATDLLPSPTNVVERLQSLVRALPDSTRPAGKRAIDLAWVLHLVGDIHQPLHASARVTDTEPQGDAGGNLFKLDGDRSLHAYWDGIVDRSVRRRAGETDGAFVIRIAQLLDTHHPPDTLRLRLKPGQYEAWGRESLAIAKRRVYPPSLMRGVEPSSRYRRAAWALSAEQIALAGHRLAAVLQEIFGRCPSAGSGSGR